MKTAQWTALIGRRQCNVCGRRWPCTIERLRQDAINALRAEAA